MSGRMSWLGGRKLGWGRPILRLSLCMLGLVWGVRVGEGGVAFAFPDSSYSFYTLFCFLQRALLSCLPLRTFSQRFPPHALFLHLCLASSNDPGLTSVRPGDLVLVLLEIHPVLSSPARLGQLCLPLSSGFLEQKAFSTRRWRSRSRREEGKTQTLLQ